MIQYFAKRITIRISLVLAFVMIVVSVPVQAEEQVSGNTVRHAKLELIQEGALVEAENASARKEKLQAESQTGYRLRSKTETSSVREEVQKKLYISLLNMEESVDFSEYQLDSDTFHDIFQELMNSQAELFFVELNYSYYINNTGTYVTRCLPEYKYTSARVSEMLEEFDAAVAHILSGVNPLWGDREKALYVHDYLVSQCEYDMTLTKRDAYNLLVEGTAVCQGYTLAYMYLMDKMGIPCAAVPSDTRNHIWNQVELDGEWYHVDLTHDDPAKVMGMVQHQNFLLSDEGFIEAKAEQADPGEPKYTRYDWKSEHVCTDTRYDTYFWKDSTAPFISDGSNWYFMNNQAGSAGIYRWQPEDDSTELLIDLSGEKWHVGGTINSVYSTKYAGMGIHGSNIYFNTAKEIRYFAADDVTDVKVLDIPEFSGSIFGLRIKNNTLEYVTGSVWDQLTEPQMALEFDEPGSVYEWPTMTPRPTKTPPTATPAVEPVVPSTGEPDGGESAVATEDPSGDVMPANPVSPQSPGSIVSPQAPSDSAAPQVSVSPVSSQNTATAAPEVNGKKQVEQKNTAISITAKKGSRQLRIRVSPKVKTVITMNKKIMRNKKKRCKKITVSAAKNKNGKIVIRLSSPLKKKMQISVTVHTADGTFTKKKKI